MGSDLSRLFGVEFLSVVAQTTQPVLTAVYADWPWAIVDCLIILTMTALLVMMDLDANGRRFDKRRILITSPFVTLVLVQSAIVGVIFVFLLWPGRVSLRYGIDAFWVSLAGISLLKTLSAGRAQQDAQKLWNVADWLFGQFHRQIRIIIVAQGEELRDELRHTYAADPDAFLQRVVAFLQATEKPEEAVTIINDIQHKFNAAPTAEEKVTFLANYITPRTTAREFQQIT